MNVTRKHPQSVIKYDQSLNLSQDALPIVSFACFHHGTNMSLQKTVSLIGSLPTTRRVMKSQNVPSFHQHQTTSAPAQCWGGVEIEIAHCAAHNCPQTAANNTSDDRLSDKGGW